MNVLFGTMFWPSLPVCAEDGKFTWWSWSRVGLYLPWQDTISGIGVKDTVPYLRGWLNILTWNQCVYEQECYRLLPGLKGIGLFQPN